MHPNEISAKTSRETICKSMIIQLSFDILGYSYLYLSEKLIFMEGATFLFEIENPTTTVVGVIVKTLYHQYLVRRLTFRL